MQFIIISDSWNVSYVRFGDRRNDYPFETNEVLFSFKTPELRFTKYFLIISFKNLICIHVDLKADERFLNALEELANCFGNVFLATKRENVIYTHISMIQVKFTNMNLTNCKNFYLKGHFNCITELLARDEKWKYYINLTADDFPVKTSIEMTSNLKELYPNSWTESTPIQDQPGWLERYEYVHNITKNLSPNQWNDTPFQMKNTGFWSHVLETERRQQTCLFTSKNDRKFMK